MPPMATQPFTGNFFVPNLGKVKVSNCLKCFTFPVDGGDKGEEVPASGYSNETAAPSSSVKEGIHPPAVQQQSLQPSSSTQPSTTQQQQHLAAVATEGGTGSSTNPPLQPITQPQVRSACVVV